jgi:tRNA(Ile)-lysidine synthase
VPDRGPHERFRAELTALAPAGAKFAVAVSGGSDSVALAALAVAEGLTPAILHVDHALRSDSERDAAHVAALAASWGLAHFTARVDVAARLAATGGNRAAVARTLRYAALARMARAAEADLVLVAHTRDDQAETVLLQALRGAAFLRGMPARSGRFLRPLLDVSRAELRAYLQANAIAWRDDPGNDDSRSARGWLRSALLPLVCERYPEATHALARLALLQRDAADALAAAAARLPRDDAGLDARAVARAPAAVARAALAALLREAGLPVDRERIEDARAHLTEAAWRRTLAPGRSWRLQAGRLSVARTPPDRPPRVITDPADLPPGVPAFVLEGGPLTLRQRRPGDQLALPSGRRSLAHLLAAAGMPREERDALALLARGPDVVWIDGVVAADPQGPRWVVDEEWRLMGEALACARAAGAAGELPVGALIVRGGVVLARAGNRTRATSDPCAHAEVLAIREAAAHQGDWRLTGATLFVTLEPCPMCLGAALAAHVARIVYGAANLREGALGGVANVAADGWKRRPSLRGGVRAAAASALLRDFFARARGRDAGGRRPGVYDEGDEDPQLLDHRPRRSR